MAFFRADGNGNYSSEPGPCAFDTLSYSSVTDQWALTGTTGTTEYFDSSGQMTSVVDHDGNITSYLYDDGAVVAIFDPAGHETDFGYTDGQLATITDFAGRTTTLDPSDGRLNSITLPDPGVDGETQPVTNFGYTSGLLTTMEDANGNTTTYDYDAAAQRR